MTEPYRCTSPTIDSRRAGEAADSLRSCSWLELGRRRISAPEYLSSSGAAGSARADPLPASEGVPGKGRASIVGRTVTIRRPRSELYAAWRDFKRLPQFMENVREVEIIDDRRSRWTIAGPAGVDVQIVARIVEEKQDELIAWESEKGASVRCSGRIVFRDAPDRRGTEVEATISYDPPGGQIGRLVAKALQREPKIQARRELKRFKQLMEAGEVATAHPGRAAPRS